MSDSSEWDFPSDFESGGEFEFDDEVVASGSAGAGPADCGGKLDQGASDFQMMMCADPSRTWYAARNPMMDCEQHMPGFDAGYCCKDGGSGGAGPATSTGCGPTEVPMSFPDFARMCYRKGQGYCCRRCDPSTREWSPNPGADCVPEENGTGYCCPYRERPEEHFATPRGKQLLPVQEKSLGGVNVHMQREGIFPKNESDRAVWKVYDCARDGNCFFDCLAKALNSWHAAHSGPPHTIEGLRWKLARLVNDDNVEYFRQNYMLNVPEDDSELMAIYASMNAQGLRAFMMSPDHYASMLDLNLIYELRSLDIIPIVVNGLYKNKTVAKSSVASTMSLVFGYAQASRSRYVNQPQAQRRYVLIYQKDEHFRLLVNTDIRVPEEQCRAFGLSAKACSKSVYRAVFSYEEVPPAILAAFEMFLDV